MEARDLGEQSAGVRVVTPAVRSTRRGTGDGSTLRRGLKTAGYGFCRGLKTARYGFCRGLKTARYGFCRGLKTAAYRGKWRTRSTGSSDPAPDPADYRHVHCPFEGMTRGRPPRLAAPLYVGLQRYSFTICCHDRQPHLESPATRKLIVDHLLRTSTQHDVEAIAYCMMPDHLHIIGEGKTDAADGLEFVRSFKQTSSYEWKKQKGGRLWQASFYDRVLRDDESTQDAVRYVLENPVRKKLVQSPEEYEHSGSLVHDRYALIEWAFGWRSK